MSDAVQGDQRRDRRIDASLQVKLRFADVERFRIFTTKDLSAGGLFVVTETPKPVGSVVQLVMYPPGIELGLPIYGDVVRVVTPQQAAERGVRPGMGIRFEDLDAEARSSLIALVETVLQAFEDSKPPPATEIPAAAGDGLRATFVDEAQEGAEMLTDAAPDEPEEATVIAPAPSWGGSDRTDDASPQSWGGERVDPSAPHSWGGDGLFDAESAPPLAPIPQSSLAPAAFTLPRSWDGERSEASAVRAASTPPPPRPPRAIPPPPPRPPERRSTDRLPTRTAVRLRFADAKLFREFYTKDVSRGGVFICTPQPLPEGSEVELLLALPLGGELRLEGRVARSAAPGPQTAPDAAGMGVEFTNLTHEKRAEINRHLEEMMSRRSPSEKLGRVRPVSAAQVRYDSPLDFVKVVRGELRHRRLFVGTDEPRPVGTQLQVFLQAPQIPDGASLSGEVERIVRREDSERDGGLPGMFLRLTDITDEYLADLDLRVRPPTNPIATSKAAKLAEAAHEDLRAGRRSSAIKNLKIALSFEPSNKDYRRALDELVGQPGVEQAAKGKRDEKK